MNRREKQILARVIEIKSKIGDNHAPMFQRYLSNSNSKQLTNDEFKIGEKKRNYFWKMRLHLIFCLDSNTTWNAKIYFSLIVITSNRKIPCITRHHIWFRERKKTMKLDFSAIDWQLWRISMALASSFSKLRIDMFPGVTKGPNPIPATINVFCRARDGDPVFILTCYQISGHLICVVKRKTGTDLLLNHNVARSTNLPASRKN